MINQLNIKQELLKVQSCSDTAGVQLCSDQVYVLLIRAQWVEAVR